MKKANVYFTNMRVRPEGRNLQQKLAFLIRRAGMDEIDFKDRFAAIKIHFGEAGNLSFLRPNFARTVADEIKARGGKPFLTDCNTLYVGSRKHALEHIETAYINGFTPYSTGCHIIIGDGLKGTDDIAVPVPNGEFVREAKIGRAVMDADIFISLNHFKGHEMTGFGGAIKNIGMGCGSRAGKMEQHCDGKPTVERERCIGCRACARICAHGAPMFRDGKAEIDHAKCVGCGRCIGVCPKDAVLPSWGQQAGLLDRKMAEYALAVVHGRPHFHISIVMDVSPFCDCHPRKRCADRAGHRHVRFFRPGRAGPGVCGCGEQPRTEPRQHPRGTRQQPSRPFQGCLSRHQLGNPAGTLREDRARHAGLRAD